MKLLPGLRKTRCGAALLAGCLLSINGCVERGEVLGPLEQATSDVRDEQAADDLPDDFQTADDDALNEVVDDSQPATNDSGLTDDNDPVSPSLDASDASDSGPDEPPDVEPANPDLGNFVTAGNSHSCSIQSGVASCWGGNASGQLGLGDATDRDVATLVSGGKGWRQIHAGRNHTCALDADFAVFCWGGNDRGQLGQGNRQSQSVPVHVDLPAPTEFLQSNFEHACAILDDSRLFCWGKNLEGNLGQNDPYPANDDRAADGLTPVEISGEWRDVSVGDGHTCGVRNDGSLWCWGRNSNAQLATDVSVQIREPTRVDEGRTDWSQAAAGQNHSCALNVAGSLWCWGFNSGSAAGDGSPFGIPGIDTSTDPVELEDASWDFVSTDTFHTCGLRRDELWCWGRAIEGQLGTGSIEVEYSPVLIGTGYAGVSVARFHTCALTMSGGVRCAGENEDGQLGTGDRQRRSSFTDVTLPEN